VLPAAGMLARGKEEGAQNLDAMLLVIFLVLPISSGSFRPSERCLG
jgi:hypothetical protein